MGWRIRKLDQNGSIKQDYTHKQEARPKHVPVNLCSKDEELLRKVKTQQSVSKPKRNPDEQSINWDAFGGDRGKLESSPIIRTKVNIKRKKYKQYSKL